jgi:hypothetical protein
MVKAGRYLLAHLAISLLAQTNHKAAVGSGLFSLISRTAPPYRYTLLVVLPRQFFYKIVEFFRLDRYYSGLIFNWEFLVQFCLTPGGMTAVFMLIMCAAFLALYTLHTVAHHRKTVDLNNAALALYANEADLSRAFHIAQKAGAEAHFTYLLILVRHQFGRDKVRIGHIKWILSQISSGADVNNVAIETIPGYI